LLTPADALGLEHPPSEELEVGSAAHPPSEQLRLVDLALGTTITPLQHEPGFDRCPIVRHATVESVEPVVPPVVARASQAANP
jgi:hypothetical protein